MVDTTSCIKTRCSTNNPKRVDIGKNSLFERKTKIVYFIFSIERTKLSARREKIRNKII